MKINKKTLGICASVLLSAFLLVSCGNQATTAKESSTGMSGNRGGFAKADLYGEVKSISGNDITLSLLEMPQRGQNGPGGGGGQRQDGGNGGQDANNSDNGTQGNGGTTGSNGDGNNGNNNGNGGENRRAGGGFAMEKKYTGETATITVSSDTTINSFGMGRQNSDQSKKTIADIKVGAIIQVWYKADTGDKKEIERISISPDMSSGNPPSQPANDSSGQEQSKSTT